MAKYSKRKLGTAYVMTCGKPWVRVGHHSTSNRQRAKEASDGSGYKYQVKHSLRYRSKLQAAAVEAVTQAILEKYEDMQSGLTTTNAQVFRCSRYFALKAILKAGHYLKSERLVKSRR